MQITWIALVFEPLIRNTNALSSITCWNKAIAGIIIHLAWINVSCWIAACFTHIGTLARGVAASIIAPLSEMLHGVPTFAPVQNDCVDVICGVVVVVITGFVVTGVVLASGNVVVVTFRAEVVVNVIKGVVVGQAAHFPASSQHPCPSSNSRREGETNLHRAPSSSNPASGTQMPCVVSHAGTRQSLVSSSSALQGSKTAVGSQHVSPKFVHVPSELQHPTGGPSEPSVRARAGPVSMHC